MGKGIADRLLFFLKPESPFRSDRVLGMVTALVTLFAAYLGEEPGPMVTEVTGAIGGMFSGASAFVTAAAALIGGIGLGRASSSPRPF